MSAVNVSFPGNIEQVQSLAELRALPSAFVADEAPVISADTGLFAWSVASLANDNGHSVIRPNDTTPLQAGRYLLVAGDGIDLPTLAMPTAAALIGTTKGTLQSRLDLMAKLYPEDYMLGSDSGQGIAFQRMFDDAASIGRCAISAGEKDYDISDTPLTIHSPVFWDGTGGIEGGYEAGQPVLGFGNVLVGTRLMSNYLGGPQITFTGNGRGSKFRGFVIEQTHPTPTAGWAPTPYDYAINVDSTYGAVDIDDIHFLGVNKGLRANLCGRINVGSIRGQVFSQGYLFDQMYDSSVIEYWDMWDFWSNATPVLQYQQAHLSDAILGRVDGLRVGYHFSLASYCGLDFVNNGYGVGTDVHFDFRYHDFCQLGTRIQSGGVRSSSDYYRHSGEASPSTGSPLANSTGLLFDTGADGGLFTFGVYDTQITSAGGIQNNSNSTIKIDNPRFSKLNGNLAIYSPTTPVLLGTRAIDDGSGAASNEAYVTRVMNNRDLGIGQYANDAAAAAGGVAKGSPYIESSTGYLKARLV